MISNLHCKPLLLCASLSIILGILGISACRSGPPATSTVAQEYELKGKVVSAERGNRTVTIDHEAIPGYMDAMTMQFSLYDDWAYTELTPGSLIQATLVVDGGKSWLKDPIVTRIADPNLANRNGESAIGPSPGTEVPDFTLVNQDGKNISFKGYRDKTLLVTFIYTRCPLPDYCPLMSRNFAQIREGIEKSPALKEKTHLLSISVDPAYDIPKVLREYGARYIGSNEADGFKQWEFASGSPEQVKNVAQFFGLQYWTEKDQIIHGLRTAIVAPDGKVFKVYRGNEWKPDQILKELEELY